MTSDRAHEFLRDLSARSAASAGVFWVDEEMLAVLSPEAARQVSARNWRDLPIPDRLGDVVRRRRSEPVAWREVRAAWLRHMPALTTPEANAAMAARMAAAIDACAGKTADLVTVAHEAALQCLLPAVLADLPPGDVAIVLRDLRRKVDGLLAHDAGRHRARVVTGQIRVGLAVRRALRRRLRGHRPPRSDLVEPLLPLLPRLGMDRAVDAVTALLVAIGGPPGAAAACLLYELARQPRWAEAVTGELAAVDVTVFLADPLGSAPLTARFVKEVLRLWPPPLLLTRSARVAMPVGAPPLTAGKQFLLSPYIVHRDPRWWADPETFNPDRWLDHVPNEQYTPFGWAPKSCVGADLGTTQLVLFCHLMCTRYRVEADLSAVRMAYAFVATPHGFTGVVRPR